MLRGKLLAFFFNDEGEVIEKTILDPKAGMYGLEIPVGMWHSIISLESGTVIFEVKKGPYQPLPVEDVASWAPAPADSEQVKAFMDKLLAL